MNKTLIQGFNDFPPPGNKFEDVEYLQNVIAIVTANGRVVVSEPVDSEDRAYKQEGSLDS